MGRSCEKGRRALGRGAQSPSQQQHEGHAHRRQSVFLSFGKRKADRRHCRGGARTLSRPHGQEQALRHGRFQGAGVGQDAGHPGRYQGRCAAGRHAAGPPFAPQRLAGCPQGMEDHLCHGRR